MVSQVGRAVRARQFVIFRVIAFWVALLPLTAMALVPGSGFTPQKRMGSNPGDQWEPAIAADGHGHIYILYPQYGAVKSCPGCAVPTMSLLVSSDNGVSWQPPLQPLPSITGQFDPQIVVDPIDRQTLYASWLQNDKRDVMVARSQDFGHTWYFAVAERSRDDADKPVLAVHGPDVYVGFNHDENFFIAASHDAGQTFIRTNVNPGAGSGSSLAGGATVDPSGNVYFGWTAYDGRGTTWPVSVYVSRSGDGGHTWNTMLLDASGTAPDCKADACETGFLSPQIALTSDAVGTIYTLWNAGAAQGAPQHIYFSSSTTGGASWSARADVASPGSSVEDCFPAIIAGTAGDVRIAWMTTHVTETKDDSHRYLWNTLYRSSTNGGATWTAESQLSSPARGYDYILPGGFRFPFGDYFTMAIDNQGVTHAVWGEGRNYKSPGTIWYTHGR